MSSLSESEAKEFHSAYVTGFIGFCGHRDRCTLVALYVEALVLRTKETALFTACGFGHLAIK